MAKFRKRIIKPGTYSIRLSDGSKQEVNVSYNRIRNWYNNFNSMKAAGLQIPAPFRHDPQAEPIRLSGDVQDIDAYKNAGFWDRLEIDRDGSLVGVVDVPREEDVSRLNSTIHDVSLLAKPHWTDGTGRDYTDAITHIALVTHPVAKDSDGFTPEPGNTATAMAFSMGQLVFAADPGTIDKGLPNSVTASAISVPEVLELLGQLNPPIRLPEDTVPENFLERLATVLNAVINITAESGNDPNSVTQPPSNSREQPGPVAMSHELDIVVERLKAKGIVNPETNRYFTKEELSETAPPAPPAATPPPASPEPSTAMSSQNQALAKFAMDIVKSRYRDRIKHAIQTGRITKDYAEKKLGPLYTSIGSLAFSSEGKPVTNQLDLALDAIEALPSPRTNNPFTAPNQEVPGELFNFTEPNAAVFSLDSGEEVHNYPEGPNSDLTDDALDGLLKDCGIPKEMIED